MQALENHSTYNHLNDTKLDFSIDYIIVEKSIRK